LTFKSMYNEAAVLWPC